MLDLHNHLLPRVDDGARSLDESLAHLRAFARESVDEVVFTPHLLVPSLPDDRQLRSTLAAHRGAFAAVAAISEHDPEMPRLALGQEIHAPCAEDAARIADWHEIGLAGSPCVLVEFGFEPAYEPIEVIETFRAAGRTVIVAHPERYWFARKQDPLRCIARWREAGAWLQVDGGSLTGAYGEAAERTAWRLLDEELAEIVATDHHGDARPHRPAAIRDRLVETLGLRRAVALTAATPARLLETWHEPVRRLVHTEALAPAV